MSSKFSSNNEGDEFKYQLLTSDLLPEALKIMKKSFYPHEALSKGLGVSKTPEAVQELEELTLRAARDGVSVVAIDASTSKVVGVAFNKLQVKGTSDGSGETFFEAYSKSCKQPAARVLVKFMHDVDTLCDVFELLGVDCLLEIMFLTTLPEYRNKGIATKLCEISVEVAAELKGGNNVKQSLDGVAVGLEPVPKAVSALFTSPTSQKVGRKLGFKIVLTKSYEEVDFEGKTLGSLIGSLSPYTTLEYKIL